MAIVAAFDKVLFYNAASKYSVLRLKTADVMIPQEARSPYFFRDHLIRFVAVGYDLPQTDAISFECDGVWVKGSHGTQLQVESWTEVIPPTIEGIRGYLASGLLKGIGAKTADAIVQRLAYTVPTGFCQGWTLAQVAERRAASLNFYVCSNGSSNVLKAAATLVLGSTNMRKAG